jgi:hypothetical protein
VERERDSVVRSTFQAAERSRACARGQAKSRAATATAGAVAAALAAWLLAGPSGRVGALRREGRRRAQFRFGRAVALAAALAAALGAVAAATRAARRRAESRREGAVAASWGPSLVGDLVDVGAHDADGVAWDIAPRDAGAAARTALTRWISRVRMIVWSLLSASKGRLEGTDGARML